MAQGTRESLNRQIADLDEQIRNFRGTMFQRQHLDTALVDAYNARNRLPL